ncbi:ATP-binding protein [Alkaliphilus transvaalensis]|uniref:ATP-binding protein n=1 Tax=Alkaliphilus transvaalensis TaxID=114628 RepID=UPI0006886464|nr:ATP-binding protein [Alkaliphilus transvaalensis]
MTIFLQNTTLIVTFTFIYIKLQVFFVESKVKKEIWLVVAVILASTLSILTMFNPFKLTGYIFDLRSVPIFFISYTLGWKVGLVSMIAPALFRWNAGAVGAFHGIFQGIILPAMVGSIFAMGQDQSNPFKTIKVKRILKAFFSYSLLKYLLMGSTLDLQLTEWLIITFNMILFSTFTLICIVAIINDFNKTKKAEKTLRISEERYKKLVELLPDGVLVYRNNKVVLANTAAAELMGLIPNAGVGQFNEIENKEQMKQITCIVEDFVQGKIDGTSVEHQIVLKDGKELSVEIRSIAFTSVGELFIINVIRDISSIRRAERLEEIVKQEKKLVEEIVQYDQLKTEFFANLSHELKTPLNLIYSTVQIMEIESKDHDQIPTENLNKRMKVLRQNCSRMIKLSNNLIDITKIDAGYFNLEMQRCNIVSVIEDISMSVAEYMKNKNITLVFDTNVEEKFILVDPNAMERIMLNLLSNAIKFSKADNEITINLWDQGEQIVISVKDEGQGIPKDKLEVIFERFRQADKLLNRRHEGSGIGLSLVKSLVSMHGGTITVKSEYGIGSEFIIVLPTQDDIPANNHPIDEHKSTSVESIKIEFSDIYSI